MPAYILTGTPSSGKTAILLQLERNGCDVVAEAATDVIALGQALGRPEPWPDFPEQVVNLQRTRQAAARRYARGAVYLDRSPVCTLALCRYSGLPIPPQVLDEVERMTADPWYAKTVFFVRNLGFVQATAARRISFEDSLVFEEIHERTYREYGFDLVDIPPGPLLQRVAAVSRRSGPG
jgi:predicted ATPase